jgi:hypothetical protein
VGLYAVCGYTSSSSDCGYSNTASSTVKKVGFSSLNSTDVCLLNFYQLSYETSKIKLTTFEFNEGSINATLIRYQLKNATQYSVISKVKPKTSYEVTLNRNLEGAQIIVLASSSSSDFYVNFEELGDVSLPEWA